jgi:hypothetical protein
MFIGALAVSRSGVTRPDGKTMGARLWAGLRPRPLSQIVITCLTDDLLGGIDCSDGESVECISWLRFHCVKCVWSCMESLRQQPLLITLLHIAASGIDSYSESFNHSAKIITIPPNDGWNCTDILMKSINLDGP